MFIRRQTEEEETSSCRKFLSSIPDPMSDNSNIYDNARQVKSNAVPNQSPDNIEDAIWQLKIHDHQKQGSPYPNRPGEPDCMYYLRTGFCGYGSNCRFHHPPAAQDFGGGLPERVGQPECQYYLRTGTCKYGSTCKFHHPRNKNDGAGPVSFNIFGLPMRQNESLCYYYIRTGSCKFGVRCKFHHPQPETIGFGQPLTSISQKKLQGQPAAPSSGMPYVGGLPPVYHLPGSPFAFYPSPGVSAAKGGNTYSGKEMIATSMSFSSALSSNLVYKSRSMSELDEEIDDDVLKKSSHVSSSDDSYGDKITLPFDVSTVQKMEYSLKRVMERIINLDVGRIGIYGGAKIHKKSFIEALKNWHAVMVNDVFENIIWVTVPKGWNLRNLQLEISRQLLPNVIDATDINSWELLMVLQRKKFLLILHDVHQFIILEKLGIPKPTPENGCKIVLIAGSEEVCDAIGVDMKIELKDLSSWELFRENVGEVADSLSLKPLAVPVVEMCCGYSLAIVLMAGALKYVSNVDVWIKALETLKRENASDPDKLEDLMANVLTFSYERLQDDKIRKCLRNYVLSCESGWIASMLLMQRWKFHGLIDAQDQGKKVLETLINFRMLDCKQDVEFVKMKKKIRHTLLEHIFQPEEAQLLFLIHGGMRLTKPPKVEQWKELVEICLMDNDISELPMSPSCPKLRKLFLERNYKLRIIPPSFFNNMPALQVLNLSRTSLKSLPESLFKLLNLKMLFLNHCALITTLSPEVGELKQLEVLDLEGTEIMYLPTEVGQLTNLVSLEVSFFEPTSRRRLEQSCEIIPHGVISGLSLLEEINIDVSSDDKRWNASAEEIISELCRLQRLHTLKVYIPQVEFLSYFNWDREEKVSPLSYFKFMVGHLVDHIISRLPCETELELEQHDRYLKYVNGEGVPEDIKKVLRHSTALFLDGNSGIRKLSDFGYRNIQQLKCLVAGQCNNLQAIADGDQTESSSGDATVGLVSLEYVHIYYMKNLRSIWEGPVNNSSFYALKYLTLRTCPELTTIFTPELLGNFSNLEELTIRDCPNIRSLVSCNSCDDEVNFILPALKRISLHFLPKLTCISNGLLISSRLELMSFQYCLNLKSLPISKVFNKNVRKIKGEQSWWQELKWEGQDSWDDIFVPID